MPTGSGEEGLAVQAGGEGDVQRGELQHQSHHHHRGRRRLRLPVHAGGGWQESADLHRQPGQDLQDLAAPGGGSGLQGGPG